jgi:rubrerythrin
MRLGELVTRCKLFEERAARLYRTYAARSRQDPESCALWTALARDEDEHAALLARAGSWLDPAKGWHTRVDGWDEALEEIATRLSEAEQPDIGADLERQLVAALALERTELDTLFHRLLALLPPAARPSDRDEHTVPLLALAARHTGNRTVAFEAALLKARHCLRQAS